MSLKIALISHYVDSFSPQQYALDDTRAVPLAIAGQAGVRRHSVQASTQTARNNGAQLIVHNLWTVYGWALKDDAWAGTASQDCTLILEAFHAASKKPGVREVLVYSNGTLISAPIRQYFVSARCLRNLPKNELCDFIDEMMRTPTPTQAGRLIPLPDNKKGLLVVCGEINSLEYRRGNGTCKIHPRLSGLNISYDELDVVVNPTHTPMRLPAIGEKRKWCSQMIRGKSCVAAANTHPGTARSRARYVGVGIYYDGGYTRRDCTTPGYTIEYCTIP